MYYPLVAQSVERLSEEQKVTGSIPVWGADGESPNGMASLFGSETMQVRFLPPQPKYAPVAQLEEATSLSLVCCGFDSHQEYQIPALVTELAYVLVLETRFCGFDSHRGY